MSLLLCVLLLPLFGAFLLLFIPSWDKKRIRSLALNFSIVNFILSLFLWLLFDNSATRFQFTQFPFQTSYSGGSVDESISTISFSIGIDGVSLFFVLLTCFLIPVCLLVAWSSVQTYVKEYYIAFLVMESLMIAVFSVLDLLLFYIFFESVLIPML